MRVAEQGGGRAVCSLLQIVDVCNLSGWKIVVNLGCD